MRLCITVALGDSYHSNKYIVGQINLLDTLFKQQNNTSMSSIY